MPLNNTVVTRFDKALDFVVTEVKKGASKGKQFLAPVVKKENLATVQAWIGDDILVQALNALLRQRSKGWSDEAEDEARNADGTMDEAKYMTVFGTMATEFNLRGESIPELRAQMDEKTDEFALLDYSTNEGMARARELAEEIKALKIAINSKKRTKEEPAEVATA